MVWPSRILFDPMHMGPKHSNLYQPLSPHQMSRTITDCYRATQCAHIRAHSLHGIAKLPIGVRVRSAYTHIPKIGLQEPQGACMSSPVKKV